MKAADKPSTLFPAPPVPVLPRAEFYRLKVKTVGKITDRPKTAKHQACDECVHVCLEVDRRGERPSLPRAARFHWGETEWRVHLCDGHKQAWEAEIDAAKKAAEVEALKSTPKRGRR